MCCMHCSGSSVLARRAACSMCQSAMMSPAHGLEGSSARACRARASAEGGVLIRLLDERLYRQLLCFEKLYRPGGRVFTGKANRVGQRRLAPQQLFVVRFHRRHPAPLRRREFHVGMIVGVQRRIRGGRVAWLQREEKRRQQRSEEHTSELQSLRHLVCRLLLEKKKTNPVAT